MVSMNMFSDRLRIPKEHIAMLSQSPSRDVQLQSIECSPVLTKNHRSYYQLLAWLSTVPRYRKGRAIV